MVTLRLLLTGSLLSSVALASDYFLSPRGSDEGAGTKDSPWRTVAKANATLAAGDVATFFPGEYDGVVAPVADGAKGAPIAFRSAKPLGAVLRGTTGSPVLSLVNKHRIALEGFHVRPAQGRWGELQDCEEVVIRNCRFEESRGSYTAFRVSGCKGVRLIGNVFTRQLQLTRNVILDGDMLSIDHCDRTMVEGNEFSKAGHGPATWLLTTNDVVRRNVFHGEWGRLFSLFNCSPILFEENVLTDNYHGSGSADAGSKILTLDGIVRRNLFVRNWDYVIHSFSYKYANYPPWVLTGTRIYNNTFACNASFAWGLSPPLGDPARISGNVWKNNVFAHHSPWGGSRTLYVSTPLGTSNVWTRNLLFGSRPEEKVISCWDPVAKGIGSYSLKQAETQWPEQFSSNYDADPQFADVEADNYTLRSASPAVDRGDFLTVATESGKGKEMKVADARWFYDGFNIEEEQGDPVMVGSRKLTARVVRADRQTNTLTLDRSLTWRKGDSVSLPYVGKAPDLGAIESGITTKSTVSRIPRSPLTPRGRARTPKSTLVSMGFEDDDLEVWGYQWWWGWFSLPGYVQPLRVSDTAAKGRCSVRMTAEKDDALLEATIAPRGWDLDRYPWVRFSYRIPPGVSVGVRLEAFPAGVVSGERRVSLGGSPACLAAAKPDVDRCRLADDDRWHDVTLDAQAVREVHKDVKCLYLFRFYSPVKWKQGWQFWLDEFEILPEEGAKQ